MPGYMCSGWRATHGPQFSPPVLGSLGCNGGFPAWWQVLSQTCPVLYVGAENYIDQH